MPKKVLPLLLLLCVCLASAAVAQPKSPAKPSPCPEVTVTGPSDLVKPGTSYKVTAEVKGGDKDVTPTYNWTISNGVIESGQGTSTITIDTTGATGTITATVDVGGYDRDCSTAASSTSEIEAK